MLWASSDRKAIKWWGYVRGTCRTFSEVTMWNVLRTVALLQWRDGAQRSRRLGTVANFFAALQIFIPSDGFIIFVVWGKDSGAVFSINVCYTPSVHCLLSGSSPCFPTSLPQLRLERWCGIKQKHSRWKNAVITKIFCFHLHFPLKVIITPF